MEKLFELSCQDQTLNPQAGTFTDASQTTGTFTLEGGEYYLTNGDTKGFYAYKPVAIQSGVDSKAIIEFDLKVVTASVNTHTIIGTYTGVDGSGIPTGDKITLQYNAGDIELALGSGTTATLIAAADVVVDQWYHFRIDCTLTALLGSTYKVKIDGVLITTVTGATTDYALGIISVLGTDQHACDECGIKNITFVTETNLYVGRTALEQALQDVKDYVDSSGSGSYIPLAGTNALAGSIVPDTDNSYDFGSSSYKLRYVYCDTAYVTNLNINGTAAGDILTHNADEFVPRSGGAVITGWLGKTTDSLNFSICGATTNTKGATIWLYGNDSPDYAGGLRIKLTNSNNGEHWFTMYPNGYAGWTGSPIVYGSDYRIKDEIESIPDEILDAWENLEPKQYKYKSDLETDKDTAQVHYGWIAQDVESVIKGDRKGEVKNGLWLHESWEEQEEVSHKETYTEEVQTKSGEKQTVTKTRKVIDRPYKAKGDSYGLRYTECLVVECKYLRRCIERLTARIEELEKGNNIK